MSVIIVPRNEPETQQKIAKLVMDGKLKLAWKRVGIVASLRKPFFIISSRGK